MELMMSGSPSATASRTNATHNAPLVRCFQMSQADATMTAGTKSLFPLRTGMSQSKNGLLNDWLMKRNSAASSDWSQAVKAPTGWRTGAEAQSGKWAPLRLEPRPGLTSLQPI
jgi:hypothetical protein